MSAGADSTETGVFVHVGLKLDMKSHVRVNALLLSCLLFTQWNLHQVQGQEEGLHKIQQEMARWGGQEAAGEGLCPHEEVLFCHPCHSAHTGTVGVGVMGIVDISV